MHKSSLLHLLLFQLLGWSSLAATSPPPSPLPLTVYEALKSYDFPVGLIPKGAESYTLDLATGRFSVRLSGGDCSFSLPAGYNLRYKKTITGRVAVDRLYDLTGVSVKLLLFWVNIIEVVHRGDQLRFSVGIAAADFGIDSFYESPQCGCGFDCVNSNDTLISSY